MNIQPQSNVSGSSTQEHANDEATEHFLALIGELAHEINNTNNLASASAQNAEYRVKELKAFIESFFETDIDEEVRRAFDTRFKLLFSQLGLVKEGCRRVTDIMESMREKSRGNVRQKLRLDPVVALRSTVMLVKQAFESKVEFSVDSLISLGEVRADPIGLNQLFTNLLVNACHAIEERKQQDPCLSGEIKFCCQLSNAGISISILDNGSGMPNHVKERLFDNFFTTKSPQKGSGLGMGICKSIAEENGGSLSIDTKEGAGTTITLWLPLSE